jgi:hypothetical protein
LRITAATMARTMAKHAMGRRPADVEESGQHGVVTLPFPCNLMASGASIEQRQTTGLVHEQQSRLALLLFVPRRAGLRSAAHARVGEQSGDKAERAVATMSQPWH